MLTCIPVHAPGEVAPGDDLARTLAAAAALEDGDVLVVTSKVVSKAAGLVHRADRGAAVAAETDRVVARRGDTVIVRNRQGLVMAAAGVDASNTEPGSVVLLPRDPDGSARALREEIARLTGRNVAVVVSDTSGRAWRTGQTDIAVGAAGLPALHDYRGVDDGYGNQLAVTAAALVDEVAAAADLVKGKLARCPAAVVRGLSAAVLPRRQHGPGARALVRDEADDLFGYGAREAVHRALVADPAGLRGFGRPCSAEELAERLSALGKEHGLLAVAVSATQVDVTLPRVTDVSAARGAGRAEARLLALAFAHGWTAGDAADHGDGLSLRPGASVH